MNRIASPLLALALAFSAGCGAARAPVQATMKPLDIAAPRPAVLEENHFQRDQMGAVSEAAMREILAAPVFLEEKARIGVVPVSTGYEADPDVPLTRITADLVRDLTDTGHFEVASEVTTDWPSARSVSGLRELATRYRAEYLLLYRHRFVEHRKLNTWGWAWLTIVGGLLVPSETIETAGVLEATLFDVKTGTLLFTVFERVHEEKDTNVWNNDWKIRKMKEDLLSAASRRLTDKVLEKVGMLVAARPAKVRNEAVAAVPAAPAGPAEPVIP